METLDGWPSSYPPGTPGVSPANQSQTMGLTGTVTGSSISMDWFCVSCGLPRAWDWNLTGVIATINNTVSGNAAFNGTPSGVFSGAETATALPQRYSGTIATFSNSCLVSPGGSNRPSQGNDTVGATIAVDKNFNATVTLVSSEGDNGTYVLIGPMIGNTLQLSGTIGSQQVEIVRYFDVKGIYGGASRSLIVFQTPYPTSTTHGTYTYCGTLNPA